MTLKAKLQALFNRSKDATDPTVTRLQRRQAVVGRLISKLHVILGVLFIAGYAWMALIPFPGIQCAPHHRHARHRECLVDFGRRAYVDEHALQPSQVNTYWNWGDVGHADRYLDKLEALVGANSTSEQRAQHLAGEFAKLGIPSSTQRYSFDTATNGVVAGTNTYAILSSPRGSGTEAMVISASWLSRTGEGDGTLNLRGVATVLALAEFLQGYSMWAKDIVFVISDGYLDGMRAWLSEYHGTSQKNLQAEHLSLTSGVIWTALNIDYPGHSFSHLGVFFEGLNGRLPNQDLFNSLDRIATYTGGVPVVLYDHLDTDGVFPSWVPSSWKSVPEIQEYASQARNVVRHVGYQSRGKASGVHGLLHQFRIDAITLFAVPAEGPHGFHAIGRVVESTLRTMNNLLERLHASYFFYILTGSNSFLDLARYLASAVLISVAMMFSGLRQWVDAAWVRDYAAEGQQKVENGELPRKQWLKRQRPFHLILALMLSTHVGGAIVWGIVSRSWFIQYHSVLSPMLLLFIWALPLVNLAAPETPQTIAPISTTFKAINLCVASTVISITTVVNFSLAAALAIMYGLPLHLSPVVGYELDKPSPPRETFRRVAVYSVYLLLAYGWILAGEELKSAVWNWEVLGVWFAPFVCIVYAPLMLQAGIVSLVP